MSINTLRHDTIYNDAIHGLPVMIIGMGATGSHLFSQLVCLGVSKIICVDPDTVESHNLANQIYNHSDIGLPKVSAAQNWVMNKLGEMPEGYSFICGSVPEYLPESFNGVVFLLTDTMESRKEIYKALQDNDNIKVIRLFETRMGAMQGEVFNLNTDNPITMLNWESTLFDDDLPSAEVSACGTALSVGATASILASFAAWEYVNFTTNPEGCNERIHFFTRPAQLKATHRM